MNYDEGFEQGQLVDQHYNPPTGDEPDEYIEGWVDGRMEQIRYEDPATADKFEAIFLGAEGFGKATYRDIGRALQCPGRALAGVSLRRGRLRRLPAQVLLRASATREGSAGYDPPAGGSAAGGEGIPAKRGVAPYRKLRQAAEHRLARLMQLGVRQARYFGLTKTCFQLLMAATVANLTLVAIRVGLMRDRNHPQTVISTHVYALFVFRHAFTTLPLRSEPGFSATLLVGEWEDVREPVPLSWTPCRYNHYPSTSLRPR